MLITLCSTLTASFNASAIASPIAIMIRTFLTLAFLSAALPLHAAPDADPTDKLKQELRASLLQLRTAQTDSANHQAAEVAAEAKSKELETKLATLEKQNDARVKRSNNEKATAEETIAKLNNGLAERDKRIAEFTTALDNWKAGYQKAADVARSKEDERAKLAMEVIELKRTVADREGKNIALFNVSNTILDRFKNYALGKAIGAREPFIGKERVEVENLVQGYKDKIIDNRISANKSKP
jgi:hypothetical protein